MAEKRYIDSSVAIDIIDNYAKTISRDTIAVYQAIRDIIDIICPTADVAPVRHAKRELIDECVNEGVYCSNCHKKIYRAEYANQKVKSNYCPNCGAKMDGDLNE